MYLKKKILALVPARGGSKGIKLKNLKKINNKTLIEITSVFIDKCKIFDQKVISSDNKKIIIHSKKLKFNIIKRKKNLSGDRVSDFKVIKNVIEELDVKFDYVVYLQPTSPIRQVAHLKNAIKQVIKLNLDGAWSVSKVNLKYHPLKLLEIKSDKIRLFNNKGEKIIARQMLNEVYCRNGVFYIFNVNKLIKQKTIYLNNILPSITNYKTVNIDSLKDLKLARKFL